MTETLIFVSFRCQSVRPPRSPSNPPFAAAATVAGLMLAGSLYTCPIHGTDHKVHISGDVQKTQNTYIFKPVYEKHTTHIPTYIPGNIIQYNILYICTYVF